MSKPQAIDPANLGQMVDTLKRTSAWEPFAELVDCLACSQGYARSLSFNWDDPQAIDAVMGLCLMAGTRSGDCLRELLKLLYQHSAAGTLRTRSV